MNLMEKYFKLKKKMKLKEEKNKENDKNTRELYQKQKKK